MAPKTYIIEHMEADDASSSLPPWVLLEYTHVLEQISRNSSSSTVIFSNLSHATADKLQHHFKSSTDKASFQAMSQGVEALQSTLGRICLLDPSATQELSPEDADQFDTFLYGGILGDDPPRDRTKELRKIGYAGRHLGPTQMTTDTAVAVTAVVIHQQTKLNDIPYVERPTITFNEHESVEMPFKYIADGNGQPTMPRGMRELLYEDMNKGFEDEEI